MEWKEDVKCSICGEVGTPEFHFTRMEDGTYGGQFRCKACHAAGPVRRKRVDALDEFKSGNLITAEKWDEIEAARSPVSFHGDYVELADPLDILQLGLFLNKIGCELIGNHESPHSRGEVTEVKFIRKTREELLPPRVNQFTGEPVPDEEWEEAAKNVPKCGTIGIAITVTRKPSAESETEGGDEK